MIYSLENDPTSSPCTRRGGALVGATSVCSIRRASLASPAIAQASSKQ